ncbi:MAG: hypothetical protein ACYYK0_06760 [Candidatus Eutrophobiaceae bacterium]
MIDRKDLYAAVDRGIFQKGQVDAFFVGRGEHVGSQREDKDKDDEPFRLVSGFNDIFVAQACGLIFLGVGAGLFSLEDARLWWGLGYMALAWILASEFTQRRRLSVTSIALHFFWMGGCCIFMYEVLDLAGWSLRPFSDEENFRGIAGKYALAFSSIGAAGLLYWRRYQVAIAVATTYLGFCLALWCLMSFLFSLSSLDAFACFWLSAGILAFVIGLHYDFLDRAHATIWTDVAFWMHLLAAFLVINFAMYFIGIDVIIDGDLAAMEVFAVFAVFVIACLLGLLANRRSLIVACVFYAIAILNDLVDKQWGAAPPLFTFMIVGLGLLFLAIYWDSLRRRLMGCLPLVWRQRFP